MKSEEYRKIIRVITRNCIRSKLPGLKQPKIVEEISTMIAKNVHARMYGANVDGVDSPIWTLDRTDRCNDTRVKPNIDAEELLK